MPVNVEKAQLINKPVLLNTLILSLGLVSLHAPSSLAFTEGVSDPALKTCIEQTAQKKGWQTADDFIELKCHSKKIQSVSGLQALNKLQKLSLYNNNIDSIDLSYHPDLVSLNLAKNVLNLCTINDLAHIREIFLFSNRLKKLSTNNLPKLEKLKANNNKLIEYKFSGLPALEKAYFFNNKLETTAIHRLPQLKYLDVRQNPMPDPLYEEMDKLDNVTILHDGNAEDWQ